MLSKHKGGGLTQAGESLLEEVTDKLVLKIKWLKWWRKHPILPVILLRKKTVNIYVRFLSVCFSVYTLRQIDMMFI